MKSDISQGRYIPKLAEILKRPSLLEDLVGVKDYILEVCVVTIHKMIAFPICTIKGHIFEKSYKSFFCKRCHKHLGMEWGLRRGRY